MTPGTRPYTPLAGPPRPRRERCMADGAKVRTVSDLMTADVLTATPSETIADVSARMADRKVGSIVVVDGTRPVGILTERDMIKVAASGTDTSIAKVSEWMTENPDTVDPSADVDDAFHRLTEHGYRHMPVVDNGKLVGIVSLRDLVRIAQIRPVEHPSLMDAPKGLEGVYVAETEIGDVRGQEGFYHYRQYNAVELAEKRGLEDVWYLLYYGKLPTKEERERFIEEKRQYREIPDKVKQLLPGIANAGDHFIPLDALRTAVSLVAYAQDYKPSLDIDAKELRHNALQITSVIPTLIMALYRLNKGQEPIDPNPDLPYSANYLYMLTGEVPDNDAARAVEHGKRIMGFGHRVYKTEDPRSRMLKGVAERLGGENVEFAKHIEKTVVDVLAELKPGRQLYANVEFYAGVVMDKAGLPRDLFTPTFASSRVIGWTSHILEQAADNRLIRPSAHYAGPPPPQPVPDPE